MRKRKKKKQQLLLTPRDYLRILWESVLWTLPLALVGAGYCCVYNSKFETQNSEFWVILGFGLMVLGGIIAVAREWPK